MRMGKVLSSFTPGWPGTQSRAIDGVVVAEANRDTADIAFGAPVWLTSDGKGVRNWQAGDTLAGFVGFAVRPPAKTPDTYPVPGQAETPACWKRGEKTEILVRGCLVVNCEDIPKTGDQVYLDATTGAVTNEAGDESENLELTGCHFRQAGNGSRAEILLNERKTI